VPRSDAVEVPMVREVEESSEDVDAVVEVGAAVEEEPTPTRMRMGSSRHRRVGLRLADKEETEVEGIEVVKLAQRRLTKRLRIEARKY